MKIAIFARIGSVFSAAVFGTVISFNIAAAVYGLDTTAGIAASVEHSDNVGRSVDNPQSDLESTISLDVGVTGTTAALDTAVGYVFTARDFKKDSQTDDEVVDGSARITWTPLPERFAWDLTHNVSDTVRSNALADIPDNRQQRNIFSTGPNFTVRLSPVDLLAAELRYIDVSIEDSNDANSGVDISDTRGQNGDSERQIGRLLWTHNLSAVSNFLAKAEYEDVKADADVSYTRLLVGYGAQLRNGNYEIFIGANSVEPETAEKFDASVIQIAFAHDFGGHGIDITLIKEVTDTSLGFGASNLHSESFNPRDTNFDKFSIVERQRADLTYRNFLICSVCTIRLLAFFDNQDYKNPPESQVPGSLIRLGDQKLYGFSAGLVYAISGDLDLLADASYELTDFTDDPQELELESTSYSLGINYNALRNLSFGLRVSQTTRDANVEGFDFDELRGGINLRYIFF